MYYRFRMWLAAFYLRSYQYHQTYLTSQNNRHVIYYFPDSCKIGKTSIVCKIDRTLVVCKIGRPVNVYFFRIIFILTRKNIIIINIPQSKYYVVILPYPHYIFLISRRNFMEHSTHSNMAWIKYYE